MRSFKPLHLVAGVATLGILLAGCSAPNSGTTANTPGVSAAASNVPDKPSAPVTLNILDVAGRRRPGC